MDKLRAMQLFVRLVDLGSFTAVASDLNVSKSMISKEITRLEEAIGARLIHRTTRTIQLTDIGEGYLVRCRKLLMQVEDADSFVQDMQGAPRGKLKINASMALGVTDLSRAFADFMIAYPDIELEVYLDDGPADLVEQGFDLSLRAASQQFDSQYIGKRLMEFSYRICASKQYLESHPIIRCAADLKDHNCFIYTYFRGADVWPLDGGVRVSGTMKVNSTLFMLESIKKGLGVGFIPDFVAREELAKGGVVEILADVDRPELTLYAMYPERQFVPPKIRHCISFLQAWLRENHQA